MKHSLKSILSILVLCASLNAVAFAQTLVSTQKNNHLSLRIINGVLKSNNHSPIIRVQFVEGGSTFLCSGALIAPNIVITARHCVTRMPSRVSVFAQGKTFFASRILIHPNAHFDKASGTILFDVALIVLKKEVSLPTLHLMRTHVTQPGDTFKILGYGLDNFGGVGRLREGYMTVSDVDPNFIYARFDGSTSNTCEGDSGGPAIYSYIDQNGAELSGIIGLTSGGINPNCGPTDLSYFTNVQTFSTQEFLRRNVPGVTYR